jgi:hypothetical protein
MDQVIVLLLLLLPAIIFINAATRGFKSGKLWKFLLAVPLLLAGLAFLIWAVMFVLV